MLSKTLFRPNFTTLQAARFTRALATTSEQAPPPSVASTNTPKPTQDAKAPASSDILPRSNETDEVKPWLQRLKDIRQKDSTPQEHPGTLFAAIEKESTIKDGHPESVQLWLAFLRRHAFYGVGMKANVWDFDDLDVARGLDTAAEDVNKTLEPYFAQFGQRRDAKTDKSMLDQINSEKFLNPRSPMNEVRKC